jgi:hypothetical protein
LIFPFWGLGWIPLTQYKHKPLFTHDILETCAIGGAVDQGWDCLVSQAIWTKAPPHMLLDIFRLVLKHIVFKLCLDKLENFGGYQRVLCFELFECLIVRYGTVSFRAAPRVISVGRNTLAQVSWRMKNLASGVSQTASEVG